ncbi:MAG: hypothetical protein M8364_14045 [Methylobacter sp.]|uniref:hypothetical protein n=1 Tax=Methylobacter sp. TaxID=2051955 RepID=UPI00258A9050|nr:hypothetical protein [Methylobacter sp.]MCL7422016.1 hypothetical protein [Methylobacter sp.]
MLRRDDDGVDGEGMVVACLPESIAQAANMLGQAIHGKEIARTGAGRVYRFASAKLG